MKKAIFLRYIFAISILLALSSIQSLYAQLSPGDLQKSHAQLEGLENCTKCHGVGQQISSSKCLACHTILQDQIQNKKGLHANPGYEQCEKCHIEHQGRDFDLIYWENGRENFNHKKTGYTLEGKHAQLECRNCHKPTNIQNQALLRQKGKNLQTTFLGLSTDCLSCHRDEHRGQVGNNCTNCHVMAAWKPAEKFDHNKADFRLTGKHIQVACEKCHTPIKDNRYPDDNSYLKFTGMRFSQCISCHTDPHKNRFGQTCTKCHNTAGWERINQVNFDHDQTNFPLRGKHAFLECEKCHLPGRPLKGLAYARCMDCHSDFHQRQFSDRASGGDCDACHTVDGFVPSTFTIAQHQKTDFRLAGAHLAIPCIACHKPMQTASGSKTIQFQFEATNCQSCHRDPHEGDADKYVKINGCTYCHNTDSWKAITFDHSQTDFGLIGRHAKIDCQACHKPVDREGQQIQLRFGGLTTSCQNCHKDIHQGQFAKTIIQSGSTQKSTDCGGCHTPNNWKPTKFDHNTDSRFSLKGAHQFVPCSKCHQPIQNNGIEFVKYKPINPACSNCHGNAQPPEEN